MFMNPTIFFFQLTSTNSINSPTTFPASTSLFQRNPNIPILNLSTQLTNCIEHSVSTEEQPSSIHRFEETPVSPQTLPIRKSTN